MFVDEDKSENGTVQKHFLAALFTRGYHSLWLLLDFIASPSFICLFSTGCNAEQIWHT